MQEKLGHGAGGAQSDVATREGRIRLLRDQIQADNDEEMSLVKAGAGRGASRFGTAQARNWRPITRRGSTASAAPSRTARRQITSLLRDRPELLFTGGVGPTRSGSDDLYQVPAGVDPVKERAWLDDQMKA